MNKSLFYSCLICLLTACSQHAAEPPQTDSTPTLPVHWKNHPYSAQEVLHQPHWWQAFNDPNLDMLIQQVLIKNNDLAIAALKVRQARLNAGLTDTNLTPDISASVSAIQQKSWQQDAANPGGNAPPEMNNAQNNTQSHRYNTALSLNYEIDLWGKLADERTAANFEAQATEQDREASALSLIGTTATLYWKQNYLYEQIQLNQQSLQAAQQTLHIAQVRYQAGAVGKLDVLQSEQDLSSQQTSLESLYQQLEETRNALVILLDEPPENAIIQPTKLADTALPTIPAGLPADVLAQRPDVKAAELRMRSEYATTQATRKSYYPTFSLTSAFSTSSEQLKSVLKNPSGSLGAGITLPFLEWQTAQLSTAKQQVIYEQAVRTLRKTFYTALSEVENQLSARQHYVNIAQQLSQTLTLAEQADKIAAVRYHNGAIDMQSWLEQQEKHRTAEKNLLENRYQQLTTQLALYQALGGNITAPGRH